MRKSTRQKLVCASLLITGVALCIGGVWFEPLLIGGVPILSAGLSILVDIVKTRESPLFSSGSSVSGGSAVESTRRTVQYIVNSINLRLSRDRTPANTPANRSTSAGSTYSGSTTVDLPPENMISSTHQGMNGSSFDDIDVSELAIEDDVEIKEKEEDEQEKANINPVRLRV